jgi:histone-lysine N-methyltransferase SETMAR
MPQFSRDIYDLADKPKPGRPITLTTPENIAKVKKLVEEDPRITYVQIEETLGLSPPVIHEILTEKLQMSKVSCRWVPHFLTKENKQCRVDFCKKMLLKYDGGLSREVPKILTGDETWVYAYEPLRKQQDMHWVAKGDPRPTKIVKQRSTGKVMVAVFFTRRGFTHVTRLEKGKTINSRFYTESCLTPTFAALAKSRGKSGLRGIFLHHDNASSHTSKHTRAFLEAQKMPVLDHPPL